MKISPAICRILSRYWTPRYRPGPRVLFDGDTVTAVILSNPGRPPVLPPAPLGLTSSTVDGRGRA